ncbi:MAG: hypothetical protein CVV05_10850 [Gammaproteobacteria bacterium HGW-Gammaproteobacteria-1]|jgi:hypothetical protein|nr:MAG: hypothetical protein CVV05_10850 [Gammaproteobacteria bacterium HGW-Gammaproteobacteria-1]
MKISSVFSNALQGIRRGMEGLDRNSARIASAAQMRGEDSPLQPLVESKVNRLQVEASGKVMRTIDEAVGSLFDDKA